MHKVLCKFSYILVYIVIRFKCVNAGSILLYMSQVSTEYSYIYYFIEILYGDIVNFFL